MSSTAYTHGQDTIIHSTTDYAKLRINPLNRPINQDHLEHLYDAIQKRNLLREFPILVDMAGVVLDGQHRLKAAEALGVPIYYIVSTDIQIEDIPETNSNTLGWTAHDHLYVWMRRGNTEYIKLNDFWQANKWMSLTTARALCHYGDAVGLTKAFARGEYKCKDIEFANTVASAALDFKPYVDFWCSSVFIRAVAMLHEHAGYSHKIMMDRMQVASTKLFQCPDTVSYMRVFTEVYNFRTRQENKMTFAVLTSSDSRRNETRRAKNAKQRKAAQLAS